MLSNDTGWPRLIWPLGLLFLLLACTTCSKQAAQELSSNAKETAGKGVSVAGVFISDTLTQQRLDRESLPVRRRFLTKERFKDYQKNMIRREILIKEARRRGLERAPEVRKQTNEALVGLLLQKLRSQWLKQPLDEEDLRRYFQRHRQRYGDSTFDQVVAAVRNDAYIDRETRFVDQLVARLRRSAKIEVMRPDE